MANRSTEQMKLYQRDRRANLRRARDVLAVNVHSGIKVTMGVSGLNIVAKFDEQQWAAINELAEVEGADPDELVQDMLNQLGLAWRRQRDERKKGENTMTLEELDQKAGEHKEWAAETRSDLLKEREEWERGVEAGRWGAEEELADHYAKYGDLEEEEEEGGKA